MLHCSYHIKHSLRYLYHHPRNEDQAWVEPRAAGYETYQYTGIKYQDFHTVCKDSNGNYYSFSQAYLVPSGCQCSSSSFCRKR